MSTPLAAWKVAAAEWIRKRPNKPFKIPDLTRLLHTWGYQNTEKGTQLKQGTVSGWLSDLTSRNGYDERFGLKGIQYARHHHTYVWRPGQPSLNQADLVKIEQKEHQVAMISNSDPAPKMRVEFEDIPLPWENPPFYEEDRWLAALRAWDTKDHAEFVRFTDDKLRMIEERYR